MRASSRSSNSRIVRLSRLRSASPSVQKNEDSSSTRLCFSRAVNEFSASGARRSLSPRDAIRVGESPVALALLDEPVDVNIDHRGRRVGVEREGRAEVADEKVERGVGLGVPEVREVIHRRPADEQADPA